MIDGNMGIDLIVSQIISPIIVKQFFNGLLTLTHNDNVHLQYMKMYELRYIPKLLEQKTRKMRQ